MNRSPFFLAVAVVTLFSAAHAAPNRVNEPGNLRVPDLAAPAAVVTALPAAAATQSPALPGAAEPGPLAPMTVLNDPSLQAVAQPGASVDVGASLGGVFDHSRGADAPAAPADAAAVVVASYKPRSPLVVPGETAALEKMTVERDAQGQLRFNLVPAPSSALAEVHAYTFRPEDMAFKYVVLGFRKRLGDKAAQVASIEAFVSWKQEVMSVELYRFRDAQGQVLAVIARIQDYQRNADQRSTMDEAAVSAVVAAAETRPSAKQWLEQLSEQAGVINGQAKMTEYRPESFQLREVKAKLGKALPNSKYYKFKTVSGVDEVIALLESQDAPYDMPEGESAMLAGHLKKMGAAGLLKEVVARVQVYNDEGSTTVIHEFRFYANDGTALILHYDVGS